MNDRFTESKTIVESKVPYVYTAISEVMAELSKVGISKDRKNQQQGYSFRGIDDMYNALSSLLANAGLCILPIVEEREVQERATKSGGVLFYTTIRVRFCIVSAKDGSKHECVMYGEAMDSGDKSTNKAMSAAYKYLVMEVFCIPTEGDNDADSNSHEPIAQKIGLSAKEKKEVYEQTIACLTRGDEYGIREIWHPYGTDEKVVLAGMFNSEQRAALRSMMKTGPGSASTINY